MLGRGTARRLGIAGIAVGLVLIATVPALTSSASATVANPGNVKVAMTVAVLTPTLTVSGISTTAPVDATVQTNGEFTIPQGELTFAPLTQTLAAPAPITGDVTVQLVATSGFVGIVNPRTHYEVLVGNFEELWSQTDPTLTDPMTNCPVGPFEVRLATHGPGTTPYAAATGTATMADGNFSIAAVPEQTTGCAGLEDALNATIALPVTTTTTTTGSSSTTTTTTTTVPGAPPLASAPVPGVVVTTTISPAPIAPTKPIGGSPFPTTPKKHHPTTTVRPTTSTTPRTEPPTLPAPKPVILREHHRRKVVHHRKVVHKKHHAEKPKPGAATVPAVSNPYASTGKAKPKISAAYRAAIERVLEARAARSRQQLLASQQTAGTPIDASLASSRHPSGSLGFDLLMLVVLGPLVALGCALIKAEVTQPRAVRRRRLFGIDPRPETK